MARRITGAVFVIAALSLSSPGVALAQAPGPPTSRVEARAVELPNKQIARLVVRWGDTVETCSAQLTLGAGRPETIYAGPAAATLVSGHGTLLVAYAAEGARAPFGVRAARLDAASPALGAPVPIDRPAGATPGVPFAVVATATPDGFAVFFEEVQTDDPSAAHTYLLRLDRAGAPSGPAREVAVPWSLADAAWNGAGFHLALLYPGNGSGMRLSMVSLTADGSPQQHPDWASGAGYISDVHLATAGGRIRAFYRGGPGGDRLLESDVTAIRGWGSEPPAARAHGSLGSDATILLSIEGDQVRPRSIELE